jgi:26S proteasome regulatory subunit N13
MSIRESDIVLAFKAGRAFRREGTNIVEPSPTKGAIYLTNGEDGLLHFFWKDRTTNAIEEVNSDAYVIFLLNNSKPFLDFQDLILFPSDASFVKVSQSTSGRVYVLKFSSSNQRHFVSFSCSLLKQQLSSVSIMCGCSSGCRYISLFFPYMPCSS